MAIWRRRHLLSSFAGTLCGTKGVSEKKPSTRRRRRRSSWPSWRQAWAASTGRVDGHWLVGAVCWLSGLSTLSTRFSRCRSRVEAILEVHRSGQDPHRTNHEATNSKLFHMEQSSKSSKLHKHWWRDEWTHVAGAWKRKLHHDFAAACCAHPRPCTTRCSRRSPARREDFGDVESQF